MALLLTSFALILLLGEFLVRLTAPQSDYFLAPHPVAGFIHLPGMTGRARRPGQFDTTVRINSYGFYDREYRTDKPPDTFRIAILGDSFVEAVQIPLEQTFHKVMEAQLNRAGQRVEVLSFGVMGFGTCDEYVAYNEFARRFRPDLVVVAFLTLNDVSDNAREESRRPGCVFGSDDTLEIRRPASRPVNDALRDVYRHSHIARWLTTVQVVWNSPPPDCEQRAFGIMGAYYDPPDYFYERGWMKTKRLLRVFKRAVEAEGSRFLLVSLANPQQVDTTVFERYLAECPALARKVGDAFTPDRMIAAIAAEEGISLLQLAYSFRQRWEETGQSLYIPVDLHWSAEGHALAAELIAGHLRDREWLPSD